MKRRSHPRELSIISSRNNQIIVIKSLDTIKAGRELFFSMSQNRKSFFAGRSKQSYAVNSTAIQKLKAEVRPCTFAAVVQTE